MEMKTSKCQKRQTHFSDERNQQKIANKISNYRPTKL